MVPKMELALKKSVGAIHSKPDTSLTLLQRKLFNVCLFHAYNELMLQDEHRIHIDLLHHYLGYKGNNWSKIDKAFEGLQSTLVCWNIFEQPESATENNSWTRVQYIGSVKWSKETREFVYSFSKALTKKLYRPDQYAIIFLEVQKKFKSEHALVLYEQCIRYQSNSNGSRWFSISEIKDLLALNNNCYEKFKQFNSRVIKPAIKEINDVSDICVAIEYKKLGKIVTDMKFLITQKLNEAVLSLSGSDAPTANSADSSGTNLVDRLTQHYQIKPKVANDLLLNYGKEKLTAAMTYVDKIPAIQKRKIANVAGYLIDLIKNNYITEAHTHRSKVPAKLQQTLELQLAKQLLDSVNREYKKFVMQQILHHVEQLEPVHKHAFLQDFNHYAREKIPASMQVKSASTLPLQTLVTNVHFRIYAKQNLPHLANNLVSLEQYTKNHSAAAESAWELIWQQEPSYYLLQKSP
jgi:hypothetical protein